MPWRLFQEDSVSPDGTWKVHVKRIQFENQPDDPRPLDTTEGVLNFVPAGVTVTVEAPPTAIAQVRTAQGDFRFALQDLSDGRALSFRDGDVWRSARPRRNKFPRCPRARIPRSTTIPRCASDAQSRRCLSGGRKCCARNRASRNPGHRRPTTEGTSPRHRIPARGARASCLRERCVADG